MYDLIYVSRATYISYCISKMTPVYNIERTRWAKIAKKYNHAIVFYWYIYIYVWQNVFFIAKSHANIFYNKSINEMNEWIQKSKIPYLVCVCVYELNNYNEMLLCVGVFSYNNYYFSWFFVYSATVYIYTLLKRLISRWVWIHFTTKVISTQMHLFLDIFFIEV